MKTPTATVQFTEHNEALFVCLECGDCAPCDKNTTVCPKCGTKHRKVALHKVICADITHNDDGGCKNPRCWKFKESSFGPIIPGTLETIEL